MSSAQSATSLTLLQRAQAGDVAAWERLCEIYAPLVDRWAKCHGLSDDDARDVTQEVFLQLRRSLDKFERKNPGDSFHGWLWKMLHRKVIDHARRQARSPRGVGGTTANMGWQEFPESTSETSSSLKSDRHELVGRAMEVVRREVAAPTWEMFWQLMVEEYPVDLVAEQRGLSVWAVYKARSRILNRLREELGETG